MDREAKTSKETHPRETANWLSFLSFYYTLKLFRKGFKQSLETDDLYEVVKNCDSKQLGDQLENQWLIGEKRSLCRALWSCYGKIFVVTGLIQLVMKTIMTACIPEALSKLIAYFSPDQTELTKSDAIYYATVVIGLNVVNLLYEYNFKFFLVEIGIRIRTAVCSLIYRKSVRLSSQSLSQATMGKITTIITKDVDNLEVFVLFGHEVWISLVQTGIACYLIYRKIGLAAMAGMGFFLVVMPLQVIIGKLTYSFRMGSSKKTDERLELTQETLSAIKVIKMYTWEKIFVDKINNARKIEFSKLTKIFYSTAVSLVIGGLCSKIAFFLFVMTYVWTGNSITAELVYFITSCFNRLEYSLGRLVPYGISFFAQLLVAVKRIESILTATELKPLKESDKTTSNPKIIFKGITTKIFDNVCITIDKGLNILIGHVGSGKTTFFKTILQECDFTGNLIVEGKISYASQEPWLFPSSIKNNIIFGEEFCAKRYQKVLEICALNYDLDSITGRDEAIVGDHGVNLSKGQQARINLARAIYRKSDIYLLDDSLAALDANVSCNIFQDCMVDFLKDKICVVTTNNFNHIKKADRIIAISHGTISYKEKPKEEEFLPCPGKKSETKFDAKKIKATNKKKVFEEVKKGGKVSIGVYKRYVGFGGGMVLFSLVSASFVIEQAATSYSEKLMSNWVTLEQNLSSFKDKNSSHYDEVFENRTYTLNLYTLVILSATVLTLGKSAVFYTFIRRVAINMHQVLIQKIVNATMCFFDLNFIGNILNRFSKDLTTIDEYLPFLIAECLRMVFVILSGVILLTSVNVLFLVQSLILVIIACVIRIFYQPTGRNLHRLDALTRSPMIGHLNATLEGLTTIRASGAQDVVKEEYDKHQNLFTSAHYNSNCYLSALGFVLELFGIIFVASIIIRFLVADLGTSVGDVGLAISQAFVLSDIIIFGLRSLSDCENLMTSVERILEYIDIDGESTGGVIKKNWPENGSINFDNVSLTYNNQATKMLNNVTFLVQPGEKMGIVGRTGAGKSSIISSLFRLYQIDGKISIDGIDIQKLSLNFLRSRIGIIPQDPILFSGTLRENLDPFHKHNDAEIWKVLQQLQLESLVKNLDLKLDKGSNLSSGQKQLICLGRVVLGKAKIVVLDEATANVDQEIDTLIHETVKKNFARCTVIIIAHRLLSVLNCQKVAVLDRGKVVEFGEPTKLLENQNSFLHYVLK